jgi:hypothetical protein
MSVNFTPQLAARLKHGTTALHFAATPILDDPTGIFFAVVPAGGIPARTGTSDLPETWEFSIKDCEFLFPVRKAAPNNLTKATLIKTPPDEDGTRRKLPTINVTSDAIPAGSVVLLLPVVGENLWIALPIDCD